MDETIGDEMPEPVNGTCIRHKENEFSIKPGSSDMLQSNEMVTPGVDDYPQMPKNRYSVILDAKDMDRIGSSEHASASPRCMDDAGAMVEELTLRNCDGEKLTVVGSSNNRDQTQTKRNQWQNLYHIGGRSGISNFHGQSGYKGKGQATSSAWEDEDNNFFPGLLDQNQPPSDAVMENQLMNNDKGIPGCTLYSSGGIRTKILSKSGFSEYFIKSTLRDKGIIHKTHTCRGSGTVSGDQVHPKSGIAGSKNSVAPLGYTGKPVLSLSDGVSGSFKTPGTRSNIDGISLREWLEADGKKANKVEKINIFRQVLDLVDFSHSQGSSLQDLSPSAFKLSASNQVMYLGSAVHTGITDNITDGDNYQSSLNRNEKRPINQRLLPIENQCVKKQRLGEKLSSIQRWPQFQSSSGTRFASRNVSKDPSNDVDDEQDPKTETKNYSKLFGHNVPNSLHALRSSVNFMLEEKWYTSPEQFNEKACTFASNIYCLGILLFELLGSFDSGRSHAAAMLDLRHRILPPRFLSENPKEAGFCLWLLHPEPSSRPTTREILQFEFLSGTQELHGGELLSSIHEEDEESDLLLYFLSTLSEQKQKCALSLSEQIQCIEADIQEVEKRKPRKSSVLSSLLQKAPAAACGSSASVEPCLKTCHTNDAETRLMSNVRQLENAYFSMRSNYQLADGNSATDRDVELLTSRENRCTMGKEENNAEDRLGGFFDGLCKYARYRKFKVRGVLRNGEFNNSANVICSLSFDRDEDYLATGGVSKKIKIFEFQALFDDSVDIHYPIVEISNKSKLSCVCWNSYIRNFLASTDYDGIVKLWDASTGQGFSEFVEHNQRAWSVDFSRVDPTKLASGSDDRLVKVWSINDRNSLCTIRSHANVCCVQFSPHSSHLLAFSSADYKTYCYDLRNVSVPWCVLAGHEKAVSYAKFLDAGTLVSASTDNTLKIWDLKKTSSNSLSKDACISSLRGHTNEKNFVGLSVNDGYITCGSETNEVFAYYKSLPMPITAHKFGSIDPITGKETEDDNGQFVSSVCWRPKSNMVVAANSTGSIKLLQLV
ncbi:protein SPA1-RELATED 2 [Salvia miltiorrhiza]|uniref:protein SPA1-RELATED 2 n=1 Tax=Salvia miltiorrhiza TaxID=226208 RepID=UPI0025AC921F|nr:protein SPA1-RELATED 2 [Salvia miltiorrhiza]XP_057810192.1 protein SPA1-RELATED 2 [Salvia miltiorrhiza]